jgi:hypothetical protein
MKADDYLGDPALAIYKVLQKAGVKDRAEDTQEPGLSDAVSNARAVRNSERDAKARNVFSFKVLPLLAAHEDAEATLALATRQIRGFLTSETRGLSAKAGRYLFPLEVGAKLLNSDYGPQLVEGARQTLRREAGPLPRATMPDNFDLSDDALQVLAEVSAELVAEEARGVVNLTAEIIGQPFATVESLGEDGDYVAYDGDATQEDALQAICTWVRDTEGDEIEGSAPLLGDLVRCPCYFAWNKQEGEHLWHLEGGRKPVDLQVLATGYAWVWNRYGI